MALIIELGSGCGVPGISASALGASNVIVTDLLDVIPLLQSTIDQNMSTIRNRRQQQQQQQQQLLLQKSAKEDKEDEEIMQTGRLAACECDWTRPLSDTFKIIYKIVIVTTIYITTVISITTSP
jgi:Lysine methyltransferase